MRRILLCIIFYFFCPLLFHSLLLSGCDTRSSEEEYAIGKCRMMLKKGWPPASQERAEHALSQWQNCVLDPVPILIDVRLSIPKGRKETVLALAFSDEDENIVGVGVREQHLKRNGIESRIIEEVYPVFGDSSPTSVSYCGVPIRVRESAIDIKDEKLWRNYVESGEFVPEAMPPLLISVPDPNQIKVWVWLYDMNDNKSDTVELYNSISASL